MAEERAVLGLSLILLTGSAAWWWWAPGIPPLAALAPAPVPKVTETTFSALDPWLPQALEHYDAISIRPLFINTRRPPKPPEAPKVTAPPPPPPEAPEVRLTGTLRIGDQLRAIVRDDKAQRSWRLATGEQVEGWTLQHIDGRRIVLARSGIEVSYELERAETPPEPPQGDERVVPSLSQPSSKPPPPADARR